MPTSRTETDEIIGALLEELPSLDAAARLAKKLRERVGDRTANSSVRETMRMLELAVEQRRVPPLPLKGKLLILAVNAAHWLAIAVNAVSAVYLVCYAALAEWRWMAVAIPIVTFVTWTVFSKMYDCPLTKLEDAIRARYRQPLVKAFLAYYVVRPFRAWREAKGKA